MTIESHYDADGNLLCEYCGDFPVKYTVESRDSSVGYCEQAELCDRCADR
jgi:hypothetical protein